jgi:hypothetical protein
MQKQGKYNLSIPLSMQALFITNFFASLVSSIPSKKFGQKQTLFIGHCLMATSLFGVLIFNLLGYGKGVLVMLICLIVFF